MKKETPLMKQYNDIKSKYPKSILLFRVGDFYETFHEDAVIASKVLGIVLTKRGSGVNKETNLYDVSFPPTSIPIFPNDPLSMFCLFILVVSPGKASILEAFATT